MKNKKQLLFALGLTVILFLMIISASYLIFSISKLGKEKKTVKSGIMLMNYTGLNNRYARQLLDMTCFSVELTCFIHNLTPNHGAFKN